VKNDNLDLVVITWIKKEAWAFEISFREFIGSVQPVSEVGRRRYGEFEGFAQRYDLNVWRRGHV
jgi:hypothetical protein